MQIKPVSRLSPAERHELTLLDSSILKSHVAYKTKGTWLGRFSIAAWVRFPEGLVEPVQLMIAYRDDLRRKTYMVDRCLPNRQTLILLNGTVQLNVAGEVSEMVLMLKGLSDDAVWILDECHVEPLQRAANRPAERIQKFVKSR